MEFKLPAGVYIIGDPRYLLVKRNDEKEWDRILEQTNHFEEPYKKDGLRAVAFRTADGNGGYPDQDGLVYGVDSGMIGIVPLKLAVTEHDADNYLFTRRVTFKRAFSCTNSNGYAKFGNVRIDRLLDLKNISRMRKLTRDENIEFQALQTAKTAAENNPTVIAAKAEASRQAADHARRAAAANSYAIWQTLCNTPVDGKYLVDNEANFKIVASWQHPGETVQNYPEWLVQVLTETPSLKGQVSWYTRLTPAQQVLQAKEDQKRQRERFELACKTHGLVINDANFQIWASFSDPVISVFNGQPCILNEDGSTTDLIPADQATINQWAEDTRNKAFQANQDKLKAMRDSNDIAGLRKAAAAEHAEKNSPQAISNVVQQRIYKELQTQYERDTQAGFSTPLPAVFTKQKIYTWDAAEMRNKLVAMGHPELQQESMV